MVHKTIKFIHKSPYRDKLLQLLRDLKNNTLDGYDLSPVEGIKDAHRIRIGDVRIIFVKQEGHNIIKKIGNRGDIYKSL